MYFGGFDTGKAYFFGEGGTQNFFAMFAFAQFVTAISCTITYPLDTVRRRLMMVSGQEQKMYDGTLDCFRKILRDEGFSAFFKGAWSNIVRGMGSALVLVLYEKMSKFFGIE